MTVEVYLIVGFALIWIKDAKQWKKAYMILKMRLARLVSHKALFWVSYRFWYIDDISNSSNQFIFFLFADFTNLLF